MFHNIQIDLLILKTYDGQFTLTTKKSLHIIFKAFHSLAIPVSINLAGSMCWATAAYTCRAKIMLKAKNLYIFG